MSDLQWPGTDEEYEASPLPPVPAWIMAARAAVERTHVHYPVFDRSLPITSTKAARSIFHKIQKGYCAYCLKHDSEEGVIMNIDHVWARGRGGPDCLVNYLLTCQDCNQKKGSNLPSRYEVALLAAVQEYVKPYLDRRIAQVKKETAAIKRKETPLDLKRRQNEATVAAANGSME